MTHTPYTMLAAALLAGTAMAEIQTTAKAAYLYHPATDTVVFDLNGHQQQEVASLVKLMTLYLLFEALDTGRVTLQSELPVSERAWKMDGSKMFVDVTKPAKVEDLIRGIAVQSGNDACIVVAEYLGGTVEGFAELMNAKAKELGLNDTRYTNPNGWPDAAQVSSPHDVVKLGVAIQQRFPTYYKVFSETEFTYSGIRQTNRNGLLTANAGVDGMKTGHTDSTGYHLLATGTDTATGGTDRLFALVMGTSGFAEREGEALKLLRYGFSQYQTVPLWSEGQVVLTAPTWLGQAATVPLVAGQAATTFLKRNTPKPTQVTVTYKKPMAAPIYAGSQVGTMTMTVEGKTLTAPLLAGQDVPAAGFFSALSEKLFYRLGL
ncbi:MAG: D-alanyl-D-alanine carboxypeptidase family protein [Alphaproteobacteria bacterium]